MNILLLDQNFDSVDVIDSYESVIWTDRYYEYGEFELYLPTSEKYLADAIQDYYIYRNDSEHMMIIEKIEINSDVEDGSHLILSGRSLESILTRRIVWSQTILDGNLQNGVKRLISEAIISPDISYRQIPNFIFKESTDPRITNLKVQCQFTGDNLYDAVQSICEEAGIGFKITLNQSKQFVFELYVGEDRSYDQTDHPYVIFSQRYDNIINSNYIESKMEWCNVTLVAGEGEGEARRTQITGETTAAGLYRRELYTDARDINSDNEAVTDTEYVNQLIQRGNEKLAENKVYKMFEGDVDYLRMFVYGRDFFIGDICQIRNEYAMEARVRITEFIVSENSSDGIKAYPTFAVLDE